MARSARQELLDHLLGEPVEGWIAARRAEGLSWRRVSRALLAATGQDVTDETLRSWSLAAIEEQARAS